MAHSAAERRQTSARLTGCRRGQCCSVPFCSLARGVKRRQLLPSMIDVPTDLLPHLLLSSLSGGGQPVGHVAQAPAFASFSAAVPAPPSCPPRLPHTLRSPLSLYAENSISSNLSQDTLASAGRSFDDASSITAPKWQSPSLCSLSSVARHDPPILSQRATHK